MRHSFVAVLGLISGAILGLGLTSDANYPNYWILFTVFLTSTVFAVIISAKREKEQEDKLAERESNLQTALNVLCDLARDDTRPNDICPNPSEKTTGDKLENGGGEDA